MHVMVCATSCISGREAEHTLPPAATPRAYPAACGLLFTGTAQFKNCSSKQLPT
ncbi:hypothetical protein LDENG_00128970 [Lucifuga dentata]|nr:hypothetical protein LDENG_00128970 [Lucifuga dentata]